MDSALKLYVWEDMSCDYTCGIAVALAHSVEEARKLIMAQHNEHLEPQLRREPDVYTTPCAFYVSGGG